MLTNQSRDRLLHRFFSEQERHLQLCSPSTDNVMDEVAERFVKWFQTHGSQHASIGLTDFPGMGRGAVALDDIAVGDVAKDL